MDLSFEYINKDEYKIEQALKFRYEIFCEEKKFFDKDSFFIPMETDHFDQDSLHFAAFDQCDNIKGYARLVCHSENGYPMQHLCPYEITGARAFIGESSAEISRLSITRDFRSSCQKSFLNNRILNSNSKKYTELCSAPLIQLGLYRMMYAACLQLDITHVFAVMEQSLYNCLSSFHLRFNTIGRGFENYGTVFPCMGVVSDFEASLFPGTLSPDQCLDQDVKTFRSDYSFTIEPYEKVWA